MQGCGNGKFPVVFSCVFGPAKNHLSVDVFFTFSARSAKKMLSTDFFTISRREAPRKTVGPFFRREAPKRKILDPLFSARSTAKNFEYFRSFYILFTF